LTDAQFKVNPLSPLPPPPPPLWLKVNPLLFLLPFLLLLLAFPRPPIKINAFLPPFSRLEVQVKDALHLQLDLAAKVKPL